MEAGSSAGQQVIKDPAPRGGVFGEERVSRSRAAVNRTSGSLARALDAASGGECDPKRLSYYLSSQPFRVNWPDTDAGQLLAQFSTESRGSSSASVAKMASLDTSTAPATIAVLARMRSRLWRASARSRMPVCSR